MHLIIVIVLKDVEYNFSYRSMLPQIHCLCPSVLFQIREALEAAHLPDSLAEVKRDLIVHNVLRIRTSYF